MTLSHSSSKAALLAAITLASFGQVYERTENGRVVEVTATNPAAQPAQGERNSNKGAPTDTKIDRLLSGLYRGQPRRERRSSPGWTNAHAQRVARKKRNVKRFRASQRG